MKRFFLILMTAVAFSVLTLPAYAGLFNDDEARKAITDLSAKVDALTGKVNDHADQLANKADKTALLEMLTQLDPLRQQIANLQGQIEVLTNEVNESQRRQKEFYVDLDTRLRKLEPQKVIVDGKESQVDQNEQKSYDASLAVFQSGDYSGAANALNTFVQMYPRSAYVPSALYSLGIAYYAQKDYKSAIATFQTMVKGFPDHAKAPEAMLNIARCFEEQKDKAQAKKTLLSIRTDYPDSPAAKTAGDRLSALK